MPLSSILLPYIVSNPKKLNETEIEIRLMGHTAADKIDVLDPQVCVLIVGACITYAELGN